MLSVHGVWVLFLLAALETSFLTGLFVPAGVATSIATILALNSGGSLWPVALAAAAGGSVGDSVGFWVGRWWGDRILSGDGIWARRLAPRRADLVDFQTKHPLFSVSVARLISFVRTLMPIAAGASGLSYRRFVPYEVLGLVGWTVLYVSIGVVGRESWMATVRWVGVGGAFVFVVVAMVLWSAGMRVGWGGRPAEGGGDV